ncbi:LURP-one-related family protein [Nocardioides sp. W7]|uniref:LURP-one-related/scramblase family protein n=1 Tax=Nocardioides sp. W7 TaxID=2931390 RepID=UPI001FD17A6E|nr:LURP-one-related family protein [Nocardioides sp. W7]
MGLRDRGQRRRDERENFGRHGAATRFQLRQKLVSVGDDFWIEDDAGARQFRVNGKALRLRDTLDLEDPSGAVLCRIQTRVLHLRDSMAIEDPAGERLALVHKALISPLRERWKVDRPAGPDWSVQGSIADHEYEIEEDDTKIAEVSKKWFRARDTYGVQVAPGVDAVLVLAVTVAVDAMAHPSK